MTIGYLPWSGPATLADRVCMRDGNVELSYAQMARRVDAAAGQFAAAGVGRGDVVAVMLPNRAELLLALMAAWRLGAAATPVNPVFTANEAGYQIADSGAKRLVASGADAGYGVPVLPVDELKTRPTGSLPAPGTRPGDLALLIYTSGSAGRPKGVMLDHANLIAMAASMGEALKLGPDDHCVLVLPLFHVNAILVSCLAPIMVGGQVTMLPRFSPDTFLAAISRYRATYFSAVPTIYARLAELPEEQLGDTSSVRFAVCGAAPVSAELLRRSESRFRFPIIEGYGLTEGTCASTINPLDGVRKPGTVGVALPGQQQSEPRSSERLAPVADHRNGDVYSFAVILVTRRGSVMVPGRQLAAPRLGLTSGPAHGKLTGRVRKGRRDQLGEWPGCFTSQAVLVN
jgi:long-chain acyl-CoA synthetase